MTTTATVFRDGYGWVVSHDTPREKPDPFGSMVDRTEFHAPTEERLVEYLVHLMGCERDPQKSIVERMNDLTTELRGLLLIGGWVEAWEEADAVLRLMATLEKMPR